MQDDATIATTPQPRGPVAALGIAIAAALLALPRVVWQVSLTPRSARERLRDSRGEWSGRLAIHLILAVPGYAVFDRLAVWTSLPGALWLTFSAGLPLPVQMAIPVLLPPMIVYAGPGSGVGGLVKAGGGRAGRIWCGRNLSSRPGRVCFWP